MVRAVDTGASSSSTAWIMTMGMWSVGTLLQLSKRLRVRNAAGTYGNSRPAVRGTESIALNISTPAASTRVASSTATADPSDRPARITRVAGTPRCWVRYE